MSGVVTVLMHGCMRAAFCMMLTATLCDTAGVAAATAGALEPQPLTGEA
jgi:hypothetical protein